MLNKKKINMSNNTDSLARAMKDTVSELKKLSKENPELAKVKAHESLVRMSMIDEAGNMLYPYNGEEPREDDFSMGPGEIKYKKLIKKFK